MTLLAGNPRRTHFTSTTQRRDPRAGTQLRKVINAVRAPILPPSLTRLVGLLACKQL